MKKANSFARWWLWVILGFGAGAWYMAPDGPPAAVPAAVFPQAVARETARAELDAVERNVVDVFQRVSPAVVNVANIALRRSFFEVMEIPQGTGTGFVWDKKGHIVTNYHVIKGSNAVTVAFSDQTTKRAKVVGFYEEKDLAVLKIDMPADKLIPVDLGVSRDLLVGQSVLAIGNPFGLDHTLTTGVVSALGREIRSLNGTPIMDMIQTDAAINSGNSGGPLLDSKGRLIGVNTAIFSPSGASAGIGFAIPVDTVRSVVTQLVEHGRVVRPGLGVGLPQARTNEAWTARLGIEGVIIGTVEPRSAAGQAGLRGVRQTDEGDIIVGDVITAIEGKKVRNRDDIYRILDRYQIGDPVEVTYLRYPEGREHKTTVKLQSLKD